MNRREFIQRSTIGAMVSTAAVAEGHGKSPDVAFPISVFSKNLQWLNYEVMAGKAAALGFDGVDLTVRPGGHVLPENVARDLPEAVKAVEGQGLKVYSIVTAIDNADDRLTATILETARKLDVKHYRLGWFHYDEKASLQDSLASIKKKFKRLEALNKSLGIYGVYQNHEGHYFGAPIWDLAGIFRDIDAVWTGSQYDIYHATIEGAHSWIYGFELLAPYIRMINIKDYHWVKKEGKWSTASVPLGEGMVNFSDYFKRMREKGIHAPISVHFEYPLGGADQGSKEISIDGSIVLNAMKKDLSFLKEKLREAGLRS